MRFNPHSHLAGEHAFLSPSSHHWVNYTLEKLGLRWEARLAAALGDEQHRYAAEEIAAGRFQSPGTTTLGRYINDSIRFRMDPEVVLYYSDNCFGTADAIAFRYRTLRISDLKTGVTRPHVRQLEVYAAIFCLEYGINPHDIKIQLRIYHNNELLRWDGDPEYIEFIMQTIIEFDKELNKLRGKEES